MSTETYLDALDVERHDECGDPVLECACETPG
jgi:hypothetical protein